MLNSHSCRSGISTGPIAAGWKSLPKQRETAEKGRDSKFPRSQISTQITQIIQEKLEQAKASSAHIGRFIRLIKKYKQPTELTKEMACELIDKIVVHEAVGKKL